MLTLSRKVGEKIVIDNKTTLWVKSVSGNTIKLSFDAPREVEIVRAELLAPTPSPEPQAEPAMV